MYPDKQFIVEDLDEIRAFVEKYPLATLVATKPSGEFAARGQDSAAGDVPGRGVREAG